MNIVDFKKELTKRAPALLADSATAFSQDLVSSYLTLVCGNLLARGVLALGVDFNNAPEFVKRTLVRSFFRAANREVVLKSAVPEELKKSPALRLMKKLLLATNFDHDYVEYFNERSRVFINWLRQEPTVIEAKTEWPKLSDEKRLDVLWRISAIQDDVFNHENLRFQPLGKLTLEDIPDGFVGEARLSPEGQSEIAVSKEKEWWDNFKNALETFIHEKIHSHQAQMADAWKKGRLNPASALYKQSRMFHEYITPQFGPRIDFRGNARDLMDFSKPYERQAYVTSRDIAHEVMCDYESKLTIDFPVKADFPVTIPDEMPANKRAKMWAKIYRHELARSWKEFNRFPLA